MCYVYILSFIPIHWRRTMFFARKYWAYLSLFYVQCTWNMKNVVNFPKLDPKMARTLGEEEGVGGNPQRRQGWCVTTFTASPLPRSTPLCPHYLCNDVVMKTMNKILLIYYNLKWLNGSCKGQPTVFWTSPKDAADAKHAARVKNSTDLGEGKRSVTEIMCIRSYCQGFLKILTIFGSLRPTRI